MCIRDSASTVSVATDKRQGLQFNYPIAAGVVTLIGTLAALDASNNLVLATDAANRRIAGLFAQEVDNSDGSAGDLSADVEVGCFLLEVYKRQMCVLSAGQEIHDWAKARFNTAEWSTHETNAPALRG